MEVVAGRRPGPRRASAVGRARPPRLLVGEMGDRDRRRRHAVVVAAAIPRDVARCADTTSAPAPPDLGYLFVVFSAIASAIRAFNAAVLTFSPSCTSIARTVLLSSRVLKSL